MWLLGDRSSLIGFLLIHVLIFDGARDRFHVEDQHARARVVVQGCRILDKLSFLGTSALGANPLYDVPEQPTNPFPEAPVCVIAPA